MVSHVAESTFFKGHGEVLILIVMDNGLSLGGGTPTGELKLRLNPYCNG